MVALRSMRHIVVVLPGMPDGVKCVNPTVQQRKILGVVAKGSTNKSIAYLLSIKECTVKWHVAHLLRLAEVNNRAELMLWVISNLDVLESGKAVPVGLHPAHCKCPAIGCLLSRKVSGQHFAA